MKTFFAQMLEEDPGTVSIARVILLATFIASILVPLAVWVVISLWRHAPADIPPGVSSFCLTSFGTAGALKVGQKFAEK